MLDGYYCLRVYTISLFLTAFMDYATGVLMMVLSILSTRVHRASAQSVYPFEWLADIFWNSTERVWENNEIEIVG